MPVEWKKTKYKGVRYYNHPSRKHGIKMDRYFTIRYQRNGKRKEEGIGWTSEGNTAEEAFIKLSELKRAYTFGEGSTRLVEKREKESQRKKDEAIKNERKARELITFSEFFTKTYFPIAQINKKRESHRKEDEHFKKWLKPVLGTLSLKKIYPLHLEKIKKNMLDAGRSPRSIEYVMATFRQAWNMAKRDNIVDRESPSKQVRRPKINNKRIRFFTHDEADFLLNELKDRSIQLHNMTLLSLHCGLRASEIFRLKWGCVHLDRGVLDVMDGKGTKNRTAYLTEKTKEMFAGMESGGHNDLVFPDRKGKKIRKISNAYWTAIDELGLNDGVEDSRQKVVFHTCRHSYASWLVQGGESLYTVQKLMGHSTLSQTERYAHLAEKNLEQAVQNFEDSLLKNKEAQIINIKNGTG
jgi:integrase